MVNRRHAQRARSNGDRHRRRSERTQAASNIRIDINQVDVEKPTSEDIKLQSEISGYKRYLTTHSSDNEYREFLEATQIGYQDSFSLYEHSRAMQSYIENGTAPDKAGLLKRIEEIDFTSDTTDQMKTAESISMAYSQRDQQERLVEEFVNLLNASKDLEQIKFNSESWRDLNNLETAPRNGHNPSLSNKQLEARLGIHMSNKRVEFSRRKDVDRLLGYHKRSSSALGLLFPAGLQAVSLSDGVEQGVSLSDGLEQNNGEVFIDPTTVLITNEHGMQEPVHYDIFRDSYGDGIGAPEPIQIPGDMVSNFYLSQGVVAILADMLEGVKQIDPNKVLEHSEEILYKLQYLGALKQTGEIIVVNNDNRDLRRRIRGVIRNPVLMEKSNGQEQYIITSEEKKILEGEQEIPFCLCEDDLKKISNRCYGSGVFGHVTGQAFVAPHGSHGQAGEGDYVRTCKDNSQL